MKRKPSQADRLLALLLDGEPHNTVEILEKVYGGEHLGIARIASRVNDLRHRGHEIFSWRDRENSTVWVYQLKNAPKPPPKLEWKEVMINGVPHMRQVPCA